MNTLRLSQRNKRIPTDYEDRGGLAVFAESFVAVGRINLDGPPPKIFRSCSDR
jgi:hypothetical protein